MIGPVLITNLETQLIKAGRKGSFLLLSGASLGVEGRGRRIFIIDEKNTSLARDFASHLS